MQGPNGIIVDGLFVPTHALHARKGHPKWGWREDDKTWSHWCYPRAGRVTFTRRQTKCDLCTEGI